MPLNVTIHPNRISITPHRLPKNDTDQYKASYQEDANNYNTSKFLQISNSKTHS